MVLERTNSDLKEHIASVQTLFQRTDFYDVQLISVNDDGIDMYKQDNSYFAKNQELFKPNRLHGRPCTIVFNKLIF